MAAALDAAAAALLCIWESAREGTANRAVRLPSYAR